MTKTELVERLMLIVARQKTAQRDEERDHGDADDLLLEYINDPEVDKAFGSIKMWYA